MTNETTNNNKIIRDLGDGLILRRATLADAERLVDFNARAQSLEGWNKPEVDFGTWTYDLATRPHPTFNVSDFTLVEDTKKGLIVSTITFISQTWSYAGIEFGVGRPELVGTHPDYRRRGLIRAQFEVVHQWSAERGHMLQAITGIPWYYRMFGYEMALNLGGGRTGYKINIPQLREDEKENYRVRPAQEADLEFIAELYNQAIRRDLIACVRDQTMWRYELNGRTSESHPRRKLCIVETSGGESVGFLAHPEYLRKQSLSVTAYELKPGVSWLAVTPTVLRYLQTIGEEYARDDEANNFEDFAFFMGSEHPVYEVIPDRLPRVFKPYAWYVRIPDLPAFLQRIAPVLEQRLAQSPVAGHSGELTLGFYRAGVRLVFEKGRLTGIEPWLPDVNDEGMVCFPDLTLYLFTGSCAPGDNRSMKVTHGYGPKGWTGP